MAIRLFITFIFLCGSFVAEAARVKDIANIRGVRSNQIVGYGLVVGLSGTGDGKSVYAKKSLGRMLDKLGMKLGDKAADVESNNVAAVVLTAELPAFARAGNKIDVVVSALGNAKSLKGGTLIQTPLRAADKQTYAVAQGSVILGYSGSGVHENVGRVPGGATIEKDMGVDFARRKMYRLTLHNPDFTTAARMSKIINLELGGKYATALDSGTIDVVSPPSFDGRGVELLATVERLDINPDSRAKVVINEKTGTVVIGHRVNITKVAITHGDLVIKVDGKKPKKDGDQVMLMEDSANVGDIVKAMNQLGVTPKDLITILQNIKAAGALQGDLEVL